MATTATPHRRGVVIRGPPQSLLLRWRPSAAVVAAPMAAAPMTSGKIIRAVMVAQAAVVQTVLIPALRMAGLRIKETPEVPAIRPTRPEALAAAARVVPEVPTPLVQQEVAQVAMD